MNLHNRYNLAKASRAVLAGCGLTCVFIMGGCKSTEKAKDDPLFGIKQPQVNPIPPTTGSNIPGTQSSAVPPIPGSTSAGSNAALASLPGGRPLAINDPRQPAPKANFVPNVQPIPREQPTVPGLLTTGSWTQSTPPITPNLPAPSGEKPLDNQYAPLVARGATGQFVDQVAGGVHLKVLVPNRTSPSTVRIFEAEARDVPTAVQAIVEQIDQQR